MSKNREASERAAAEREALKFLVSVVQDDDYYFSNRLEAARIILSATTGTAIIPRVEMEDDEDLEDFEEFEDFDDFEDDDHALPDVDEDDED